MPKRESLARKFVIFGDEMKSGFGYPKADIPKYLAVLDELDIPSHLEDLQKLVIVLRKEVEGSTQPVDYQGLLSDGDLEFWENSNIVNRRVPRH